MSKKQVSLISKIYKFGKKKFSKGYGLGKIKPARIIIKRLESKIKSDFTIVNGFKMYLDPADTFNLSINDSYGDFETELMKNQIKEGDIVIDVGANIGYFTLLFSKLVGETGKVFAFEPESRNFELLKKNIQINKIKNVVLEQKIVSNKNGKSKLFISDNIANHKIFQTDEKNNSFIELPSIILDDYFEKINFLNRINFVKVDVEGAEFFVFDGMRKILNQNKEIKIFTEFMHHIIKNSNSDPKDIVDIFINEKFNIDFVNSTYHKLESVDINQLSNSRYAKGTVNLFCQRVINS